MNDARLGAGPVDAPLGDTPLTLAATRGNRAVLEALLSSRIVDVRKVNGFGQNALAAALGAGRTDHVPALLEAGPGAAKPAALQLAAVKTESVGGTAAMVLARRKLETYRQ